MNDGLVEQWRAHANRALGWKAGDDPTPVLEALALSVALELTGDLAYVGGAEREQLRKIGQRALLFVGAPIDDEDELEARRLCAEIARDGLRALSSRPLPEEARSPLDARMITPPGDLVRLLAGRLDGFAAGSLAMRVRRSDEARGELSALIRRAARARGAMPAERTLALAAADPGVVLDPGGGRAVGSLTALGAEAVLFEGPPRRLAVYAEDPQPLRLVASELTTEDVREGYWVGRVAEGATRIEATLHAGERAEPWLLDLSC